MTRTLDTTVCVVGGGPAGMMVGVLLARQGIDVVVCEKHPDFFRDFRGDTIHPSTLELFRELGWLDELLHIPHTRMDRVEVRIGARTVTVADFTRLPATCPYIAFMPQWDFLTFLAEKGRKLPEFHLLHDAAVHDLAHENARVVGAQATLKGEELSIRADLVIGADGRHSTVRRNERPASPPHRAPHQSMSSGSASTGRPVSTSLCSKAGAAVP